MVNDDLKKLVKFGLDLGEAAVQAAAAPTAIGKAQCVLHLFEDAPSLMTVNWSGLKADFAALSVDDMDELKNFVNENFDIADDELEAKIKASLEVVVDLAKVFESAVKIWHKN